MRVRWYGKRGERREEGYNRFLRLTALIAVAGQISEKTGCQFDCHPGHWNRGMGGDKRDKRKVIVEEGERGRVRGRERGGERGGVEREDRREKERE